MTDMPLPSDSGALAQLADLGPYFALPVADHDRWRCLPEFLDDAVISGHVDRTRSAMADSADCPQAAIPIRTAASAFQLGVAARLLSPVIGGALCLGAAPILDASSVRWLPAEDHVPRFGVTGPTWAAASPETVPNIMGSSVLPVLIELSYRLENLVSLSRHITLGNLASAANGAVTVLTLSRPELTAPGRALVRALVHSEPLRGTGAFVHAAFRRNSCCLYYRAPRSGLCGDCVLVPG